MQQMFQEFLVSDEKTLIQPQRVFDMLSKSYWAADRTLETIKKSIENSLCFGVYYAGEQVGFARCITDYATSFLLVDVIIDDRFRGKGLGTRLIHQVIDLAKQSACHKLRWQVSNWNKPAIAFYKSLGASIDDFELDCDLILD